MERIKHMYDVVKKRMDVPEKKTCKKPVIIKLTILGYELSSQQNAVFNYLLPSLFGCLFYILHFAVDAVLVYRHYHEENPIWAGLSLFFIYLPVIGCFVMTVSAWELWPEFEGCGSRNIKWFFMKVFEHLFFPIWSMWRFAERIFWSIEAVRCEDIDARDEALHMVAAPRTIEFYYFLQGYLQTIPQILLQLHILMRHVTEMNKQTVDIQAASILLNISQMASTTVLYQRFKSQTVGGKNYPWFKPYKYEYDQSIDQVDSNAKIVKPKVGLIYCTRDTVHKIHKQVEESNARTSVMGGYSHFEGNDNRGLDSRRSSDFYLEPNYAPEQIRERVNIIDGDFPILRTSEITDEVDIPFPKAIRLIKALPEDDLVGKIVSFLWWQTFLIARFLAISTFAYFYPKDVVWLLSVHFILCVSFLLYDVQSYVVRRTKAVFFIFIGFIYLFCIIEFKKQFKKAKFIYYAFFGIVFTENFVMCLVWWCTRLDTIYNDWWFKYVFFSVLLCTFLSLSTMLFYYIISKPMKVVVGQETI